MALAMKPDYSDEAIAKHVGVRRNSVASVRVQLAQIVQVDGDVQHKPRIGVDGKARRMPRATKMANNGCSKVALNQDTANKPRNEGGKITITDN